MNGFFFSTGPKTVFSLALSLTQISAYTLQVHNLKVHTSDETRQYLATVPGRFEFVFTPKHGSWLNLIEGFFSKLTRQSLKGIRVKTKEELVARIYKYFDEVNEEPVVYHWKYRLDEIDPNEELSVDTLPIKKSS